MVIIVIVAVAVVWLMIRYMVRRHIITIPYLYPFYYKCIGAMENKRYRSNLAIPDIQEAMKDDV